MKSSKAYPIGSVHTTNEGSVCSVVAFNGYYDITVEFDDAYGYRTAVNGSQLKDGRIKNPYFPSKWGMGFIGYGKHKPHEGTKQTKAYVAWSRMLERCYSIKSLTDNPTYLRCTVDPLWLNFQEYAEWYTSQNKPESWQVDKDILVQGNTVYSPETCRLVPQVINSLILTPTSNTGDLPVGVFKAGAGFKAKFRGKFLGTYDSVLLAFAEYRRAKLLHIKSVAEEYKDQLDAEVYEALLTYDIQRPNQ